MWAKLEGHPWWPCMVAPQPVGGQQLRGRGKSQRLHVHFFDEPPTRGWVSTKYIREYQGEKAMVYLSKTPFTIYSVLRHSPSLCRWTSIVYLFLVSLVPDLYVLSFQLLCMLSWKTMTIGVCKTAQENLISG